MENLNSLSFTTATAAVKQNVKDQYIDSSFSHPGRVV